MVYIHAPMNNRTATLLGATGLVGGHCLSLLLNEPRYGRVVALGRRTIAVEHPKLRQYVIDFERPQQFAHLFETHDLFCCLGTTIKKAGSRAAFRRVDFTYPHECARLAARAGAEQLLLVSSLGADARSRIFYSRVKGELEEAISQLPFKAVQIFRPSLLLGTRAEARTGERVAEKIFKLLPFIFSGPLRKYRPVEAHGVAAAMVRIAGQSPPGVNLFESRRIAELASTGA